MFQLLDYGANQAHIHVLTVPPSVTDPAVDGRKENNGDEIVNLVTYACVRVGVFCHQTKFSYSSLRTLLKKHRDIADFKQEVVTLAASIRGPIQDLDAKLTRVAAQCKAETEANCKNKSIDVAKAAEQKVVGMCGVCTRACVCVCARTCVCVCACVCVCVHVASTRSVLEILEPKPNQNSKLSKHFQTWGLRRTLSLIPHRCRRAF